MLFLHLFFYLQFLDLELFSFGDFHLSAFASRADEAVIFDGKFFCTSLAACPQGDSFDLQRSSFGYCSLGTELKTESERSVYDTCHLSNPQLNRGYSGSSSPCGFFLDNPDNILSDSELVHLFSLLEAVVKPLRAPVEQGTRSPQP